MMAEGPGTHRAQLFWRWCMGFQATSKTIHDWAWWFAAMTGITGAIGVLLSGTVIFDWYAWAVQSGFVAPPF
jgi:photosynthetic reaction center M subunit